MDIKPSPAILTALASLSQGGSGVRAPASKAEGNAGQTAEAATRLSTGVDVRVGTDAQGTAGGGNQRREAPGTNSRPLQPGLGRLVDLTV